MAKPDDLRRLSIIIFFFCGTFAFSDESLNTKLKYRISLNKDSLLLYEHVIGEVCVKNISRKPVRVLVGNLWKGWVIQNQHGNYYRKVFNTWDHSRGTEIKRGDSLSIGTDISEYYGIKMSRYSYMLGTGFPAGKYLAYYKMNNDSTSPSTFKVFEPKGDDSSALELFLDAQSLIEIGRYGSASIEEKSTLAKETVSKLRDVAEKFPHSRYASMALEVALSQAFYKLKNFDLLYEIIQRLVKDYPENAASRLHYLQIYYEHNGNLNGYRDELKRIIKNKAHPKLVSAAKAELKKQQKNFK